ncbi:MAG: hypothetical protein IM521_19305 [Microcystis sp. M27BS1]|nr:hypothetical protein [Microcystis sp. M27BS1]
MTPDKFIIKCPTLNPEKCRGIDMEKALEEIKFSKHCLVFYESYNKGCKMMFTGFNKEVFSMLVVLLAESKTSFDFLKLAIVTVEKLGSKRKGKSNDEFLKSVEGFVGIHFDKGNPLNQ